MIFCKGYLAPVKYIAIREICNWYSGCLCPDSPGLLLQFFQVLIEGRIRDIDAVRVFDGGFSLGR